MPSWEQSKSVPIRKYTKHLFCCFSPFYFNYPYFLIVSLLTTEYNVHSVAYILLYNNNNYYYSYQFTEDTDITKSGLQKVPQIERNKLKLNLPAKKYKELWTKNSENMLMK